MSMARHKKHYQPGITLDQLANIRKLEYFEREILELRKMLWERRLRRLSERRGDQ